MQPDGQLLSDRYALAELIASGGMGQVWRAHDTVLDRDVAVKVLRREYTENPTFLARFRAEAQHTAGLVHPNIATLFDYDEIRAPGGDTLAYLVMELVRGESLSTLLRREHRLSPERTLDVLRQCAAGLAAAHAADVVHRDVKPGNVLLGADGAVKLTDFGVAVSAASVPLTRTGEVIGTANYLSPEQVQGHKAGPASDVYALGLIGYECLAGHRGFEGGTPTQIALRQVTDQPAPLPPDVPEPLRRLIERALEKDPARRFTDGAALLAAIDVVDAGRPAAGDHAGPRTATMPAVQVATPPPPMPRTRAFMLPVDSDVHDLADLRALEDDDEDAEPAGRRRWPLVVIGLLTLLVLGGGSYGFLQLAGQRPESAASTPSTTAPSVALVRLTLSDYVGRPVRQVQSELVARGLPVTLDPRQTADVPADQVIEVSPVGQLAPGTPVTVTYAVAPPPPPTPTPTPEATPTPTPTAAQDNGNGDNGGDNGGNDRRGNGHGGDGRGDGRRGHG